MELQLEDSFDPVLVAPPSRRPKHLRRKLLRKSRTITGAPVTLDGNPSFIRSLDPMPEIQSKCKRARENKAYRNSLHVEFS